MVKIRFIPLQPNSVLYAFFRPGQSVLKFFCERWPKYTHYAFLRFGWTYDIKTKMKITCPKISVIACFSVFKRSAASVYLDFGFSNSAALIERLKKNSLLCLWFLSGRGKGKGGYSGRAEERGRDDGQWGERTSQRGCRHSTRTREIRGHHQRKQKQDKTLEKRGESDVFFICSYQFFFSPIFCFITATYIKFQYDEPHNNGNTISVN